MSEIKRLTQIPVLVAAIGLGSACVAGSAFGSSGGDDVLVLKVGKILTMNADDDVINNGTIVVRGTTIAEIGKWGEVDVPAGADVIEMTDCWLVPGLVEAHNHTGGSMSDLHDYVYLTNPGLRTLDTVAPQTPDVEWAQSGGVTSALLIPGSGTNMSGFGTVVKFAGKSADEAVLKFPASIKIAQAGNPEGYWWGVGRMFMNYNLRATLEQAREYNAAWEQYESGQSETKPLFNPMWDDFRGLYRREFVASVHTQIYQVVMTTVDMLADKLAIRTVLDHSTFDGWKTARLVTEQGDILTMNGPRQFHFDRTQRKIHGNAARWWQSGIRRLGVNTDAPVIPQHELSYQGAMACWYGWTPYEALRGITRVSSEALMVDDRIGSIEVGKDADVCIWSGDPIDPRSTCWIMVINGDVVRDARDELRRF
ncbi:MAG: hypothetical protein D8M59_13905 [Planctomycetes bacterium]|nr:hypothetical protein [Planctomycetota bacterium]NOG55603.1 amidohydrolase family protein [Planctomycetota bacterium]